MDDKPLDIVLCGTAFAARDLFLDARDLARADNVGIAWQATRHRIEYVDRVVEWVPISTAHVHLRGKRIRDVHVDRGMPTPLLTPEIIETVVMCQLTHGRRDWTWGDRQTQNEVQAGRGDAPAPAETHGR
jgi:hypothetical protein